MAAPTSEVDGLLAKVVQAASLTIRFSSDVQMLKLYNELPAHQIADGEVVLELGDLYAEESRKLVMRFGVPAMAALGLAQVATLELRYVGMPALVEHTVTLPVTVNVVPGDEAAGRVPDPVVRSERLYQEAQLSKRQASEAFEAGDVETGKRMLEAAATGLDLAVGVAPADQRADLLRESDEVDSMLSSADAVGTNHMSKRTRASYYRENTKRGRRRPSSGDS